MLYPSNQGVSAGDNIMISEASIHPCESQIIEQLRVVHIDRLCWTHSLLEFSPFVRQLELLVSIVSIRR
jgi:hypothetical protein